MRVFSLILLLHLCCSLILSQTSYRTAVGKPVVKLRTLDLNSLPEPRAFVQYLERPKPGGEGYHRFLHEQKIKATALFPERQGGLVQTRSLAEPPTLIRSFFANAFNGIPLDNHLAVNRQDQVVSVINTHMVVLGPTGTFQKHYSLDDFWSPLGEVEFYFDPRIMYDPREDRYIIAMMQDSDCGGSNIVFAFSVTHDPTGAWHMYQFEGCPNNDDTFADFPMIALTQDELFFTYNAVYQDSTWQMGFNETFIYQINKFDGYAGQELRWRSWSDIRTGNRLLRYICPVKYGTEDLGSEMYLLSNRSFDIQNDTVFLLHINGNQDHPNLELTVEPLISDRMYGVPPNARQPMDFLQTNDARMLDAFYVEDHIQFVSNTMDTETGRSAVYHGIITDVMSSPVLSAEILHNGADHFAYPAIAYTGAIPGERDAIIIASHSSADRYPGYGALYYNEGHSDWITVKEGQRNINMLNVNNPFGLDPTLERWGDYSGIQRQWNEVGTVYSSSSWGKPGSVNDTWIGYLARPEGKPSSTVNTLDKYKLSTFPNPTTTTITFEAEIPAEGKLLEADLFDVNGNLIHRVFNKRLTKASAFRFQYDISSLQPGTYFLSATLDGVQWKSEKILIQ